MRALAFVSHLSWHPSFPFWWIPTYSLCKTQLQHPCFKKPSQNPSMEPTDIVNIQGSHASRLLTPFPKGSAFSLLGLCDTLKREGPGHSWENIWGLGIPLLKRRNSHEKWWQLIKAHWQQRSYMDTNNLTSWRPQENGAHVVADTTSSLCSLVPSRSFPSLWDNATFLPRGLAALSTILWSQVPTCSFSLCPDRLEHKGQSVVMPVVFTELKEWKHSRPMGKDSSACHVRWTTSKDSPSQAHWGVRQHVNEDKV